MIKIVLAEPRIAGNVGTIGRLCFNLGLQLHLIGPHFLDYCDKKIMRAGLDYWPKLRPVLHENAAEFLRALPAGAQLKFASTKAAQSAYSAAFGADDWLIFGSESYGLPQAEFAPLLPGRSYKIPMQPQGRSLNLAVSVGMFAALALAQNAPN